MSAWVLRARVDFRLVFHVIVVFLVSDRRFVFGFCWWMLFGLSMTSGFALQMGLVFAVFGASQIVFDSLGKVCTRFP